MTPYLDGDIILYECGFAAETGWQGEGIPSFDYVSELVDERIKNICALAGGTTPPIIFFSGPSNFRIELAKTKPYKGTRKDTKPYHYYNIKAYLQNQYECMISDGIEADDLMSIMQCKSPLPTIICSRDKDLRQVPGWYYSWELGNQPSFGPEYVEGYGRIWMRGKKLEGVGDKFFLAQCIMGDTVDNIPGIVGYGPSKAFKILQATSTYEEGLKAVIEAYKAVYGDSWEEMLLEQGQLLWLVREINEDGTPIMWRI